MSASPYFQGTPFALTASLAASRCWAGRPQVRERLLRLQRGFKNRADSTIDLIWANLGAGKSHALFHLAHIFREGGGGTVLYLETPHEPRTFLDLYRALMSAVPAAELQRLVEGALDGDSSTDLSKAARALAFGGDNEKNLAAAWLRGEAPYVRELKTNIGIAHRVEDDAYALEVFNQVVANGASRGRRCLILLDEFQRLGRIQERYRSRVLSAVRSIFSSNPVGVSLVVAAGTRLEATALSLLPGELRTLLGPRPTISLPEMSEEEAVAFAVSRLACFRPDGYRADPSAPFGENAIRAVTRAIVEADGGRLIPRTLLQALAFVFDEMCDSEAVAVDPQKAAELCSQLRWNDPKEG